MLLLWLFQKVYFKDNTVTFPILHFCKRNCAFFFLFSMAVVISHIGNVAVLSSGKNGLFWLDFFSRFFFTLGSRITFFRLTYFRKRYVFKKEIIYLFFVCLFFRKEIFAFPFFFCKKYNQKLGGEKEIRDREKNGKMILNCRKKCLSLKLILYLAKIFDFEFQHHDHQTSL